MVAYPAVEVKAMGEGTPEIEVLPQAGAEDRADRMLQRQIIEAAAASAYTLQDVEGAPMVQGREVATPAPASMAEQKQAILAPRTFLSWLETAPAAATPTMAFGSGVAPHAGTQDWLGGSVGASSAGRSTASGPSLTRELIDRFLVQSTPEPKRTEFFSPQQAGKRSIEENLDIATETLARIHEKQGHWARAARIYHHLALKHPEKSGYFAALAKKAEDNLNP
jgi:hypothetical protein